MKEACPRESIDPSYAAAIISSAYENSADYANALKYASQCIDLSYSQPACHFLKIRALANIPHTKNFEAQRERVLRACSAILQNSVDRLSRTDDELERLDLESIIETG
jgi:hypothetical protein